MTTWCILWRSIPQQKSAISFIAKIDLHKILFPLTPSGFVSKKFSPMASWLRDGRNQQKIYTVVFKSAHALEQYPKIKFRVRVLGFSFFILEVKKQSPGGVLLKSILKNFAKFTGWHLCQNLFFNKVAGWGLQLY